MITEDYVSFETGKLLKEKGFGELCHGYFRKDNTNDLVELAQAANWNDEPFFTSRPTLQMAMKWLREVHGLHVEVVPNPFDFKHQDVQDGWGCEVMHLSDLSYDGDYEFFLKKYSTYEEACEAAIKYCLNNINSAH